MLFLFIIQDRAYGFTVCVVSAQDEDEARGVLNEEYPAACRFPVELSDRGEKTVSMEHDE